MFELQGNSEVPTINLLDDILTSIKGSSSNTPHNTRRKNSKVITKYADFPVCKSKIDISKTSGSTNGNISAAHNRIRRAIGGGNSLSSSADFGDVVGAAWNPEDKGSTRETKLPVIFSASRGLQSSVGLFQAHEETADDRKALVLFKDFDIEVRRWLGDGGLEEPLHRISAFADFLSSTYVAQRLDYLRSSSVVSAIRKKIVHQIECLALGKNPTTKENGNFMLSENYNKDTEANLYRKSRCNTGGENREQHKTNLRKETRSRNTEELKYPRPCLDNRCGKNHYPAIENINNVQLHSRALSQSDWKCRVCSNLNVMKSPKCTLCGKLKAEKAIGIAFKNWKAEHNHCKVDRAYRKNNKHKTNSAYTVEERRTKKKNESMKREYRMFVESKLRLDDQASLHRNFADEIQSVLADIRDCNS